MRHNSADAKVKGMFKNILIDYFTTTPFYKDFQDMIYFYLKATSF